MSNVWLVVFWTTLALLVYTYLGYPLVLAVWSRHRPRPFRRGTGAPELTLIIAVHNERYVLEAKIRNCRALRYPAGRRRILIVVDGSTDGTDEIALRHAGPDLEVICLPEQRGKAAALGVAMGRARGELVVFADARQRIDEDALTALVAPFADPAVGVVTGELVLVGDDGREASDGIGVYWRYEKWIRARESRVHSVVGATGALYAIRRSLLAPIPEGTILDDVAIPLHAVLQGFRCVFEPGARVYDRVACCAQAEQRRKIRTLAGNYQLFAQRPELLLPWRNPVWLQLVSHKVARLLAPYALVALLVSNAFLAGRAYRAFFLLQIVFYAVAAAGAAADAFATARGLAAARAAGEA